MKTTGMTKDQRNEKLDNEAEAKKIILLHNEILMDFGRFFGQPKKGGRSRRSRHTRRK